MRSQIRGLNQAKRNAQDGISMIQTFEGAAQETHTILQRMKELATESANGTYDNPTDRAAIQLEFDQLNDELNQLADTDFNGTIVLNGGEMSDGLKADETTGTFNYKDKQTQLKNAIQVLKDKRNDLDNSTPSDITIKKDENQKVIFKTVDENKYGLDEAKKLWEDLELDAEKVASVDVTFTAKVDADTGAVTYEATKGVKDDGTALAEGWEDQFTPTAIDGNGTDQTGIGGFSIQSGGELTKVIFDASKVKTGDVITLKFMGPGVTPKAPAASGFDDDTITDALKNNPDVTLDTDPSITMKIEDDDMTEDITKIFDAFNGVKVKFKVATGLSNASIAGAPTTAGNDFKLEWTNSDNTTGDIGFTKSGGVLTVNGQKVHVKYDEATAGSEKLVVSSVDDAGTGAGDALFEVSLGKYTNAGADTSFEYGLAFASYAAPKDDGVDIKPIASDASDPKIQAQIDDIDKEIAKLENDLGVSVSDAYDNSAAIMTYTEHIILQTGARSKDAVDFTFNYNLDKTADMGNLDANLNLSSRDGGLETANLSLATAEDANHAIDQIDKAINKTSMVRASFGAIQNRLDYKIENLTTTSENLTEAESNIRDTDMANEMLNYTKFNILQQAAQSMLAQANQQPQSILQLLG